MADGDDPDGSGRMTPSAVSCRGSFTTYLAVTRRRFVYEIFALAWIAIAALAVLIPALSHGAGIYSYTAVDDKVDSAIPLDALAGARCTPGIFRFGIRTTCWVCLSPSTRIPWLSVCQPRRIRVSATSGLRGTAHRDSLYSGTGVYVFGRFTSWVLGSVFAAIAFEISGALIFCSGLAVTGTVAGGVAFRRRTFSVVRGKHRARRIAAFAVFIACRDHAGQPQVLLELLVCLVLFLVVLLGPW